MKRLVVSSLIFAATVTLAVTASSQPPGGPPGGKAKKDMKGPPRFVLGKVFPPGLRDQLKLTDEQAKQIDALEKELKEKLDKILTAEQKKAAEEFRPRGPGGPPEVAPPPEAAQVGGGIQWYATLEGGLAEAKRTGKPILFVSAAPHCAGVSGIW